jgi:uncharacterized protein YjbI with pentapeptide repeats
MKIIKPMRLGVLTKVFEHGHEPHLAVSLLLCFPFDAKGRYLHEASLWKMAGEELGRDAVLDECNPKLRGEVLVTGRCFTPGGVPRTGSSVRVEIGSVDKTLYVVGDRRWGTLGMSDPAPFTELPVSWRNAFGGEGYAENPLGKGFAPIQVDGTSVHSLPNIEDPRHLVKASRDRPTAVGFEGYDLTWPQRASKAGTYDEAWLKHERPGFPRDFDPSYFNVAPVDQQIEGFFLGDERFVIENMHPDEPRLEGVLPGVAARCFIAQKDVDKEGLSEAMMRLDTVRFFPHRRRGILVFRGVFKIREDDAADVLQLVAACEAMGEPKSLEHYQTVLAQRLDKKTRHLFALRDHDLMPHREDPSAAPLADDRLSGVAALIKRDDYREKQAAQRMVRDRSQERAEVTAAREQLRAAGINPEAYFPTEKPEPPAPRQVPSLDEVPEFIDKLGVEMAEHKARSEREIAAALVRARSEYKKQGFDFDKHDQQARKEAGGPPKLSAKKELERLEGLKTMAANGGVAWPELTSQLQDPDIVAKLVAQEEDMLRIYRRHAHYFPVAARLEGDEAKRIRDEVIEGRAEGRSFAGCDLTGADLSHLDLSGIDLEQALLEAAVLTGVDLRNANLTGAVFARADLGGVDLTGAILNGANFGGANLRDVKALGGLDLTDAVFAKADLSGADFTGAKLSNADFSEATFEGADFSKVIGKKLFFLRVNLSSAILAGADLQRCSFIEVDVSGVDFSGANLSASTFITARGDGAVFRDAKLDKLRLIKDSTFAGADFCGASMQKVNLMGTRLTGSDFTGANLRSAVLNDADLSGAKLDYVIAVEAMLVRTNLAGASLVGIDLMQSILQKVNLRGANLEKANLFGSDASQMVGDEKTSLAGANVKRVNFVAARRPDEQG